MKQIKTKKCLQKNCLFTSLRMSCSCAKHTAMKRCAAIQTQTTDANKTTNFWSQK